MDRTVIVALGVSSAIFVLALIITVLFFILHRKKPFCLAGQRSCTETWKPCSFLPWKRYTTVAKDMERAPHEVTEPSKRVNVNRLVEQLRADINAGAAEAQAER
jgi:hypothetical protein